jgi:hypothetical protein
VFERRDSLVRAGVFIGIDRVRTMPPLRDAGRGARAMHEWALGQGLVDARQAKLITDEDGRRVTADEVQTAVERLLDGPGVDQLIIYFAGHGVYANRTEHWLLSDAPERAQQAINVAGSVELAKTCGAGHVVIISDACRKVADTFQLSRVSGQDLFLNLGPGIGAAPIDQLFACGLGNAAFELRDPEDAAGKYRAIYTDTLLEALDGRFSDVLEESGDHGDPNLYIDPRVLGGFLSEEVPRRLVDMGEYRMTQRPDYQVASHNRWVARVSPESARGRRVARRGDAPVEAGPPRRLRLEAAALIRVALSGDVLRLLREMDRRVDRPGSPERELLERLTLRIRKTMSSFGPDRLDTGCGVKVRGTRISDCLAPRMTVVQVDDQVVRVESGDARVASAVLTFADGTGTAVPLFAGYLTTLTVVDGELVDVGFEPSMGSSEVQAWGARASAVRATRAAIAAAADYSRLDLDRDLTALLLDRLRDDFRDEPAIAVHLATMLNDQQAPQALVDELLANQVRRFGVGVFDVSLLSGSPTTTGAGSRVVPFVPLLSRNWALLRARGFTVHPALQGIETTTTNSLWSMYDQDGVRRLRAVLSQGDLA